MTLQANYKLTVLHGVLQFLDRTLTEQMREELNMPEILNLEVAILNKIRALEAAR